MQPFVAPSKDEFLALEKKAASTAASDQDQDFSMIYQDFKI